MVFYFRRTIPLQGTNGFVNVGFIHKHNTFLLALVEKDKINKEAFQKIPFYERDKTNRNKYNKIVPE